MTESDQRQIQLTQWIAQLTNQDLPFDCQVQSLRPASSDASFRRYFRLETVQDEPGTLVVMDAPPPQEDCEPFVRAARIFGQAGVNTPVILASDLQNGFLLLNDFGQQTLLDELNQHPQQADHRYRQAGRELVVLQQASKPGVFAPYDRAVLLRELRLFDEWYLARQRKFELSDTDRQILHDAYEQIIQNNLAQPTVFVHRDYHSRNLMVTGPDAPLGVLDFQDALYGPITYDLVSLLRDAYIQWPEEQVLDWSIRYWEAARGASLPVQTDFSEFYRDLEWMGLQRHLKVLGIFARLFHRDGKASYLDDMPVVLNYVQQVARRFVALSDLARLLDRLEQADPQPAWPIAS